MTEQLSSNEPLPDNGGLSGHVEGTEVTRRGFLALAGAGGVAALLASCSRTTKSTANKPVSVANPFTEPEVLRSNNGRLEVTLRAEAGDLISADSTRYAYTYNGASPGPTLSVRPGDQLVINLENQLDIETNLHTHGLHVSPTGNSDNIFITVPPGAAHTFTYDIPADHRSGVFWYHPHVHGTVAFQVAAGLVGAIIIEDQLDSIAELMTATKRLWVLTDPPIGSGPASLRSDPMDQMMGRTGPIPLVNGVAQPRFDSTTGQLEQWRIVNASPTRFYRLAIDNQSMHLIGTDGGRLERPVELEELLLTPGERAEVLIAPASPGESLVRALAYNRGQPVMGAMMGGRTTTSEEAVLAAMQIAGQPTTVSLPDRIADPTTLQMPAEPAVNRTLELGMAMGGMMNSDSMMAFTIDGKTFDPNRIDIASQLEQVEDWVIRNTTEMDHPFHLHTWPFQVVERAGPRSWKDTVNVPAHREVRIRIPITGYTGRTVYHCHILDHEDLGMMGIIEVTV